ncbi:MAG TPA: site-2 protease family protein [Thermoleophilaceae bacterium]
MSARREEGPLHASFGLGRVAGVEIGVNWSWIVVVGLVSWSLGAVVFPDEVPGLSDGTYLAMALIATVLFFASLLLHELGHAVVARREGMEIAGITLWLFGGVARFNGMFPSGGAELRIALAGPAVSLFLGLLFLGVAAVVPLPDAVDGVVAWLGRINLILFGFNMLPALPLDGGRVLRALLWLRSGDFMRATRTAGGLGRVFGNGLMILGALAVFAGGAGGLWLIAIGFFLSAAAQAEVSFATTRTALSGLRVRDAMVAEPESVPADSTLAAFVSGPFARSRHAAYPVMRDGQLAGLLYFRDLAAIPPGDWDRARVDQAAVPIGRIGTLSPDDDLAEALMQLADTKLQRALVVDGDRLAGLLSITDVSRLLEIQRLLLSGFPRSGSAVSTVPARGAPA